MRAIMAVAALAGWLGLGSSAYAQEEAGDDALSDLYSHRFAFTSVGLPILNVMLMEGQDQVRLTSEDDLLVLPSGDGGSEIRGGRAWSITVENAQPAKLRFWTIVDREGTEAEAARWRARGVETKLFETGIVFGISGDLIDSRQIFLGVSPESTRAAAEKVSRDTAVKWNVETFLHPEMVSRPQGTLIARADGAEHEVRNPQLLWFQSVTADAPITVRDVIHGDGGSQVNSTKRSTRRYAGKIYVTLGWDGSLTVVNSVASDRLLQGTVPAEIFPDAPMEALKAQAVAARDELFSKLGTRDFAKPYVTCASQQCQVYAGLDSEHPRTSQAVAATRGEVLFRAKGSSLIPAYYSASCGGHTEHNDKIWGAPADPGLRGKVDSRTRNAFAKGITDQNLDAFLDGPIPKEHCQGTRFGTGRCRWTARVTNDDLDRLIAKQHPQVGRIQKLVPEERGVSGRIRRLTIQGDQGKVTVTGDLAIRRLLGGLRSTLFRIRVEQAKGARTFVFDGAGFGHGVGMCQLGAIAWASAGRNYKQILEHYYSGVRIKRLY